MIGQVAAWMVITGAGAFAVWLMVETVLPAAGRIWDVLSWREHDRRLAVVRSYDRACALPPPTPATTVSAPRVGPEERFLADMEAGR